MKFGGLESELPDASVACTEYDPTGVVFGTVNVAVKSPFESVMTVEGDVTTTFPPNVIVIAESAAYPVPVTVTVAVFPEAISLGLMLRFGTTL